MNCPHCKTKNPTITGWYGCMPGHYHYLFDCCGNRATSEEHGESLVNMLKFLTDKLKEWEGGETECQEKKKDLPRRELNP